MSTGVPLAGASRAILAQRLISLTDLTSLNESDDAAVVQLYEQRFGSGSASPGNFRIGASALFKELLTAAEE
jgi:hypothetical protein